MEDSSNETSDILMKLQTNSNLGHDFSNEKEVNMTSIRTLSTSFSEFRKAGRIFFQSKYYIFLAIIIILFNTAILATYTRRPSSISSWTKSVETIDHYLTLAFSIDLFFKFVFFGFKQFFTQPFYVTDLLITAASCITWYLNDGSLSPLRLIVIVKVLPLIPGLSSVNTILVAMKRSIPLVKDIAVLTFMFFLIWGIMGMKLFEGVLRRRCVLEDGTFFRMPSGSPFICSNSTVVGFTCPSRSQCLSVANNPDETVSFDNILSSWLTIFQILTAEGWSDIMVHIKQGTGVLSIVYFLTIIFFGNYILLQLLVSVAANSLLSVLNENSDASSLTSPSASPTPLSASGRQPMSTPEFNASVSQLSTVSSQSDYDSTDDVRLTGEEYAELPRFRKLAYDIYIHRFFDRFIAVVIISNAFVLGAIYNGMSPSYRSALTIANYGFTACFSIEAIIKLVALAKKYFTSVVNIIDFTVTVVAIVELADRRNELGPLTTLRLVRAFLRTVTLFRLMRLFPQVRRLLKIVLSAWPLLRSLIAIWILSIVAFACIGIQFFSGYLYLDPSAPDKGLPRANFDNFVYAVLSIFQLYSVENWNDIEASLAQGRGIWSTLFAVMVIIIGAYILSQMLLAIIISTFLKDLSNRLPSNPWTIVVEHFKEFRNLSQSRSLLDVSRKVSLPQFFNRLNTKNFQGRLNSEEVPLDVKIGDSVSEGQEDMVSGGTASSADFLLNPIYRRLRSKLLNSPSPSSSDDVIGPLQEHSSSNSSPRSYILALHKKIAEAVRTRFYTYPCLAITLASCVVLAFEPPTAIATSDEIRTRRNLDVVFASLFTFELIFNVIGTNFVLKSETSLHRFWNSVDAVVVLMNWIAFVDVLYPNIRFWSLIRTVRLLKLIKMAKPLRVVTTAVLKTLPTLQTALFPFITFLFASAILGLHMFIGFGYQCTDISKSKAECTGSFIPPNEVEPVPRIWHPHRLYYDDIFQSLLSTFVIVLQEGWPDDMYRYIDIQDIDGPPVRDASLSSSVFFVGVELIGNWFFLSVVTGLIFDLFKRHQDNLHGLKLLSEEQKQLLTNMKYLFLIKPPRPPTVQKSQFRRKIQKVVTTSTFRRLGLTIVAVNIIVLLINRSDDLTFELFQNVMEIIFTCLYIIEISLLYLGLGWRVLVSDKWNILKILVVVLGIVSLIVRSVFAVTIPNVFLLLRILRVIKLFPTAKGFNALILSFIMNAAGLFNVFVLMFLLCYSYALLGVQFFGTMKFVDKGGLNSDLNFQNFGKSLLTVYTMSSGENWPGIMANCMVQPPFCEVEKGNCGYPWAPIFFLSLQFIMNWILLNAFIAIVVDSFHYWIGNNELIVDIEKSIDHFHALWIQYDYGHAQIIQLSDLIELYKRLEPPLAFKDNRKLHIQAAFSDVNVYGDRLIYIDVLNSLFVATWGRDLPNEIVKQLTYEKAKKTRMTVRLVRMFEPRPFDEVYAEFVFENVARLYAAILIQNAVKRWLKRNGRPKRKRSFTLSRLGSTLGRTRKSSTTSSVESNNITEGSLKKSTLARLLVKETNLNAELKRRKTRTSRSPRRSGQGDESELNGDIDDPADGGPADPVWIQSLWPTSKRELSMDRNSSHQMRRLEDPDQIEILVDQLDEDREA
ncbi:Ion transport protein-domain-containing protein [Paraphysoderma sedebokerense]|nr:Ion transport protein-domain-containing protein [Paraphysoderma sedebokerense]